MKAHHRPAALRVEILTAPMKGVPGDQTIGTHRGASAPKLACRRSPCLLCKTSVPHNLDTALGARLLMTVQHTGDGESTLRVPADRHRPRTNEEDSARDLPVCTNHVAGALHDTGTIAPRDVAGITALREASLEIGEEGHHLRDARRNANEVSVRFPRDSLSHRQ